MQFLWKYIDDLIGKGLDVLVIAELMLYASSTLVPLALPLSVLLSSIMTFGNLGQHNELMALKAAGVSLPRILFPLVICILFISAGAYFFANSVMPYTNLKMGVLLHDVRKQSPEISIKEGIFSDALEGYSIKVSGKNKETGMLYNIMIYNHAEKNGNRMVTVADSATMKLTSDSKFMILTMYQGQSYNEMEEKKRKRADREYPHRVDRFEQERILIDMSDLGFERSDENIFKNHYQMLNIDQLDYAIDSLKSRFVTRKMMFVNTLQKSNYMKRMTTKRKDSVFFSVDSVPKDVLNVDSLFLGLSTTKKISAIEYARGFARNSKSYVSSSQTELKHKYQWISKHEIEWHRKFTLPFSCILLFFVGAPLGAIIRKGGLGMPVVISVLFFVIYYVIGISGEKSARIGAVPAWWGMWLSGIVIFPISLFLTYKAATDSVILEVDTYIKPFKKAFSFLKNSKNKIQGKTVQNSNTDDSKKSE